MSTEDATNDRFDKYIESLLSSPPPEEKEVNTDQPVDDKRTAGWRTDMSLYEMTDAAISKLMTEIRQMPDGTSHFWFINNPNADERRLWAHLTIWVMAPVYFDVELVSERLKHPGCHICGYVRREKRFYDLRAAEKYVRRRVSCLQRKWRGINPAADRQADLERRKSTWRST
jgi:hypothetical protein